MLFDSEQFFSYMGSIPVIPSLSIISLFAASKNGPLQIKVREQTPEETEHWKKMKQLAAEPNPKLIDVKDVRMMQCNPPCNRQFAGRLLRTGPERSVLSGKCPVCEKEYNLELKD